MDEAKAAARQVLALQPGFTVRGLGKTVGFNPEVFTAFAGHFGVPVAPRFTRAGLTQPTMFLSACAD
jgi:hypothetical protein